MRLDDYRFLSGPNRYGQGPFAGLRVQLEPGEDPEAVALILLRTAEKVGKGAPCRGVVVRPGLKTVSLGVGCPNRAWAASLVSRIGLELGFDATALPSPPDAPENLPNTLETPPAARVPIVAITGTNGKSTTARLTAAILTAAGHLPGITTSDGVWIGKDLVLAGDYSGPQGATRALAPEEVTVGVLEIARGGILLKGLGVPRLDAGVITNVDADHLGLDGVETVEELAIAKAAILRAVKPDGRCILNGADRFTPELSALAPAPVALFARDANLPTVIEHLTGGGEAWLVRDGWLVHVKGPLEQRLVAVNEVPIALGGAAKHNVENALAASAAAHALGASLAALREGLRSFKPSPEDNPGRLNIFAYQERTVIVDFAHNPHGLNALLDVADALAKEGRVVVVVGTAGDRRDEDLFGLGEIAQRRCAEVVLKRTVKYLRGRTIEDLVGHYQQGVARAGGDPAAVPIGDDEVSAFQLAFERSRPGDVIAIMCQEQRRELWDLLGGESA